jgi:hypothetical protein
MAISCGHVSIPVHRIILCSASPYFESALPGMLRVSSYPVFDGCDYNIEVLKAMVQFVYTGDYTFHGRCAGTHPVRESREVEGLCRETPAATCQIIATRTPQTILDAKSELEKNASIDVDIHYEPCFHFMMRVIADNYQILALKSRATEYFCASYINEHDKEKFYDSVISLWNIVPWYDEPFTDMMFRLTNSDVHDGPLSPPLSDSGI